jgi:hypothetical protein
MQDKRNVHRSLVGKPEENTPLRTSATGQEDNNKMAKVKVKVEFTL